MKTSRPPSKSIYIALLRGINVSGHKPVKMDQLRKAFEELAFEDVKTYVQSGNVVFKAPARGAANLTKKIEEKVVRQFGFSVSAVVKTAEDIANVIENNPLVKEEGIDPSKLHVTFLSSPPEATALKKLDSLSVAPDRFHCSREAIYLYCPNGYGKTKVSNNVLEKMLKVTATTRNWKTVNQLYEMSLG
jgi:uncharacterized protein (DUF1697 family)